MRLLFLLLLATAALAQSPKLLDPALRLEALCTVPDIESPTTVVGAPDGSFYVGCDPRDARLNTDKPECYIVRFSSMGAEKKRTVFADKIYSPAGSAWHDGWLYVAHDPFLTRFRDTDGDGIADVREDLITNLGKQPDTGLNDHLSSGFILGMDGFFYMSIGDRGTYQTKSVKDGSTISMQGGGIIRFRPDGTALEIFSTGTRNHLAVCLDAEDNAFTLDNTDDGNGWWTRLTHHIEGGYYGYPYDYQKAENFGVTQPSEQTVDAVKRNAANRPRPRPPTRPRSGDDAEDSERGRGRVGGREREDPSGLSTLNPQLSTFLPAMADFGPGSPTGGLCYLSDGLPEKYRGRLLFSEWGKQNVSVIEVARDGATFRFVKNTPLLQGGNGSDFRPMQLSVAADGSLLIADWQWGGWKGPKTVGTLWRLSWPDAKIASRLEYRTQEDSYKPRSETLEKNPAARVDAQGREFTPPTVEELLAALAHPDRDQRLRAQGALIDRTLIEAMPRLPGYEWRGVELIHQINAVMADDKGQSLQRIHAMWTIAALARLEMAEFSKRRIVRGNAALHLDVPIGLLGENHDPVIRAQAVRALLFLPENETDKRVRLKGATSLARRGLFENDYLDLLGDSDVWVQFAARMGLRFRLPEGTPYVGSPDTSKEVTAACLASNNVRLRDVGWQILPTALDTSNLRGGYPDIPIAAFLQSLGSETVALLAPFVSSSDAQQRTRALTALARIAYQAKPWDGHWWGTQPVKNPPALPGVAWEGTAKALETLTAALADADSGVRLAAAQAFANFLLDDSGKPAAAALRARLTAETDPAIRRQLIESLGVQKDPQAMEVFRQIALGDPDMNFRETAIAAVVNIGGDDARKTIAQLASTQLSPAATRKIIQAAGELKVLEAAPALIAHLSDENAGNREAAIKALAAIKEGRSPNRPVPRRGAVARDSEIAAPWAAALDALMTALSDTDTKVQAAAVEALGSFKDKRALPALLDFSKTKRARRETINAIAALMPDSQALPFLVDALREKGTGERRAALTALKKMRAEAWPMIEENLASGRIPAEFAPEIRMAFDSGAIAKWKLIGPFENVWEAVHPPERDLTAFALVNGEWKMVNGKPGDAASVPPFTIHQSPFTSALAKRYVNAEGQETRWIDVNADNEGRVDLGKVFKTSGMVCAYAFAEIESPEDADARLFCGSDDQIAVWLNGKKLHDSGAGSRGFNADQDEVPIHFTKGRNALVVKIGNVGGGWEFAARIPGVDGGKFAPSKEPAPDAKQRAYALATKPNGTWQNPGDATRGEKLFHDPAAALGGLCATCHKVRGLGKETGPDLSLVGSIYQRADLIVSILEPSKTIALGFEQNMIETNAGETFIGALRQETGEAFTLVGIDGQSHVVKKTDVKTRLPTALSLMPPGLTLALKPEDFTDLLAYLETLK